MKLSMPGIAVLLVLTVIALSFAVTPVIAQAVEVRVNAPEYVEEGATFVATIDVDSVTDLTSAQFDLSFDKSVIEVSDVKDGKIDGEKVPIFMWILNPTKDTAKVIVSIPSGEVVSGSGNLAEVKFDVKAKEGEKSGLTLSNGILTKLVKGKADKMNPEGMQANWTGAEIIIGVEEDDEEEEEEEVGEEVIPGSPVITTWKPADAAVSNAVGESRTFNITVDQIADISWQINGTEVQTNESTREAVYTNASADIGTWNVSAIATNTTTGLSDLHTWIWSVTLTPATTVTPSPTLAPGVTPTPTPTLAPGGTPTPEPAEKAKPTPTPKPTPKPAVPGFEVVFAIVGMVAITYLLLRRR